MARRSNSPKGARANSRKISILAQHRRQIVHLEIAGGEMVVPHQGQPLAQRIGRKQHAEDPPRLQPIGHRRRCGRFSKGLRHALEITDRPVQPRLAGQHSRHARLRSVVKIALDLGPRRGKTRPDGADGQPARDSTAPRRTGRMEPTDRASCLTFVRSPPFHDSANRRYGRMKDESDQNGGGAAGPLSFLWLILHPSSFHLYSTGRRLSLTFPSSTVFPGSTAIFLKGN